MMLSPSWLFAFPASFALVLGVLILGLAGAARMFVPQTIFFFGNYWVILAGALVQIGHIATIFALACSLYGIRQGYRRPGRRAALLSRWVSLETMLTAGLLSALAGIGVLTAVVFYWSAHHFVAIDSVLPAVIGTSLFAIGVQNIFGGFLLSVVGGNEANFFGIPAKPAMTDETARRDPVAPESVSAASGS
jgi:hypothetical protein